MKNILQTAWTTKTFPDVWKSGVTVLAYKKGDAGNPENFIQPPRKHLLYLPVLSKTFTSVIRNRLFNFASKNKYIEKNLQKGFWQETPDCIKRIVCLSHTMNNARLKKRDCVVALSDLQNHCVKSVRIWSISGLYFHSFALKTKGYGVSFSIQSKCGKIRTIKSPNTDTFQALNVFGEVTII